MKIIYRLSKIIIVIVLVIGSITETAAQDYADSRGKDFWLTYLPNFHNNRRSSSDVKYADSLYLFITSDEPTKGKIEYTDRNGNSYDYNFEITDVSKIYTFKVSYWDYELLGFNDSGLITTTHQNEKISHQSFHLTSENDVTIYAHSQSVMTSDAFLVLPTDVLGTNYFILTYMSDGSGTNNYVDGGSTPSQFAIVATEDNTKVTIYPSSETHNNSLRTQNITMNRGDVYLVQSKIDNRDWNRDLSGTEIVSDKPIAVFSGNQRSNLPVQPDALSPSRDFICEQMPPVKTWGKDALLVPYPQPQGISTRDNDIFRILSAYDGTQIFINNIPTATLNKGKFYEGVLTQAASITANAPILVAQFKKTSQQSTLETISDPFMMIIPQVEQFGNFYRFINLQAWERSGTWNTLNKVYTEQWLTIVIPENAVPSIRLDGSAVPPAIFKPIPTTGYVYGWVKMSDGTHTITANDEFGIYVYGYGQANSYGYFGGMNFKKLDFKPPEITGLLDCFKISGFIYDTTANDSKISEVSIDNALLENVTVSIESFKPAQSIVKFEAELIDKYNDGKFSIFAKDSAGLYSIKEFEIPGFTVKAITNTNESRYIIDTLVRTGSKHCFTIYLENYGRFPQEIVRHNFRSNNPEFSIQTELPILFNPGNIIPINVCFSSDVNGEFLDTLEILSECGEREIAVLKFIAKDDDQAPQVSVTDDPCNREFTVSISDSLIYDFGIESIELLDTVNCDISIEQYSSRLARYKVLVIDQYQDAYYKLIARDSAGHESIYEQAIPGFTISITGYEDGDRSKNFGLQRIGSLLCDSVLIHNYGNFTFTLDNLYFYKNLNFSLPYSQFPLKIEPGETVPIFICFHPLSLLDNPYQDTLEIEFNCLIKSLPVIGNGDELRYEALTRCGLPLKLNSGVVPDDFYIKSINPNPAVSSISIVFSLPEVGELMIRLINSFGEILMSESRTIYEVGIYEIRLNISDVPSGFYYIHTSGKFGTASEAVIINK